MLRIILFINWFFCEELETNFKNQEGFEKIFYLTFIIELKTWHFLTIAYQNYS